MSYREEIIGGARLILGDCREVLAGLSGVDAVVTDPPYGIGYAANPICGKGKRQSNHASMAWDDETVDIHALLSIAPSCVIWGGNYYELPPARGWLSWFKPDAPPSMGNFELAWTNLDRTTRQISHSIAATNAERVGHPTQKPVAVMQWCLMFLPDAITILDPFMGSGTTGVACAHLGRKFIGIECHEPYFNIAVRRITEAQRQGDLLRDMPPAEDPADARMADMFAGDAA